MIILILMLTVLALGVVLAVIVSRVNVPGVEDAVQPQSFPGLADGITNAQSVREVRLDVAVRGYRMDQVDGVLQRLAEELSMRDAEIARLRQEDRDGDL